MKLLYTLLLPLLYSHAKGEEELFGRVSESLHLICPHSVADCGEIHSMKWYRGTERIYVYSPFSSFSNAEGILVDRSTVVESGDSSDLEIQGLLSTDDGNYRCEITYMDVSTSCPSVFLYTLTTTALPESVVLSAAGETVLSVDRPDLGTLAGVLGPYQFEDEVEFACEVLEVKPAASVTWRLAGTEISASGLETEDLEGGGLNMKSFLKMVVGRDHLASSLSCSVEFEEAEVANLSVELDVLVPPESVEVNLVDFVAGQEANVICKAEGGRPSPQPVWLGLDNLPYTEDIQEVEEDDLTYTVTSTISFQPEAEHHQTQISCSVDHPALADPLEDQRILNVKYAPAVKLAWEGKEGRVFLEEEEEEVEEGDSLEPVELVVEGDSVKLSCIYNANPTNNTIVTWFYNETEMVFTEEGEERMEDEEGEGEEGQEREIVTNLILENLNRTQTGTYSCSVSNEVGMGTSPTAVIDVQYVLEVGLELLPGEPVLEGEVDNVTLVCLVLDGNPAVMESVMWFYNNDLMNNQDCNDRVCEYSLNADRTEAGLYSCKGLNLAGEGEQSNVVDFIVHYPSSEGAVETDGAEPVKGLNATLFCGVEDLGNPPAESFIWTKNGVEITETDGLYQETNTLYLDHLDVEAEANYSCSATNVAGSNFGQSFFLDVLSGPEIMVVPPSEVTIVEDYQWINLTCQVECAPACVIKWFRNMELIIGGDMVDLQSTLAGEDAVSLFRDYEVMLEQAQETGEVDENEEEEVDLLVGEEMIEDEVSAPFFIETTLIPADENQFESVLSTLYIQLGNRTREMIEMYQLMNLTCLASDNGIGPSVQTSTLINVEHAPLDVLISHEAVSVVEGEQMFPVFCSAISYPPSEIVWKIDEDIISDTVLLNFNEPVERSMAGEYTCEATNVHGSTTQSVYIDVQYPPQCTVTKEVKEEEITLKCSAVGNPEEFVYWWSYENTTFEGQEDQDYSYVSLQFVNESSLPDYKCFVNNTAGKSQPCSIPRDVGVVMAGPDFTLLLVLLVVGAVILVILLAAWCLSCRNKGKGSPDAVGGEGGKGKGQVDDQPHPDSNFYDNLPFQGLKNPPKKVLNSVDDDMVYADVDAQETYSYGPLNYKSASLQKLNQKKKQEAANNKINS